MAGRLSLQVRATLAATAVVAVALVVAAAVLDGVLGDSLRQSAELDAGRRAAVTAAQLTEPSPRLVSDPDITVVPLPPAAPAPGVSVGQAAQGVPSWETTDFVVARQGVVTEEGPVLVTSRASLLPAEAARDTLWAVLLPGIPALLLLVAGLTWAAVGRALRPVAAIRRELADITATDLHRRVPVPRGGDEIAALAATTNATLDRLEQAVGRHQRFVADAAHELRSPLAVLRTRLEIDPAPGPELRGEALADVERIQRLSADLLLLARLDAGEPPESADVDLSQLAAEEAVQLRTRSDVAVVLAVAEGVVVRGSAEQLRRLVANLVDNAVRHATSTVEVRLTPTDDGAVLDVLDDGPGIPVAQQEAVFDRFTRLDEARARDSGGSGLGLAIVRDIAVRHGGTAAVVDGPPGAHLQVRLPG
ncbi:sensor histidine kinase [Pseudonocardia sp. CA-107938]|uniref:sensor histidine kinase n=1 Tax=Pseudonocardia sp. CA-107938 TaxID=3240021 RepID=UPI003D93A379